MISRPFFSVIIPTYNRELLLKRAIDSVLSQTYTDCEILVVDDGSTDQTQALLRQYTEERGDRIHTFRQENSGKSVALNNALSVVHGRWITFLDSDDYWLPEKLKRQYQAIHLFEDRCGACFTDARYMNNPHLTMTAFERSRWNYEGGMGVISDAVELILTGNHGVYVQTLAVRADIIRDVEPFDPQLRISEDTDFLYRLALKTGFCYVNCPLVCIERDMNRIPGLMELFKTDSVRLNNRQHMYEKWLALSFDLKAGVRKTIRSRLQGVHSEWANWHLSNRAYREARRAISTAAHLGFDFKVVAKWLLIHIAPGIGRRIVLRRMRKRMDSQVLWYA
jgi:glycosyltransferase involved in cell wall biosynthesis